MNKVFLIGNLTRDPEMRTTPSGVAVCTFSIAVNRRYAKDKQEKEADYFNIVAWRSLGELCGKYLAKGRKVSVVGELQNRSYDDKEGVKRYVTEIIADEVEFLSNPVERRETAGAATPVDPSLLETIEVNDEDLPF